MGKHEVGNAFTGVSGSYQYVDAAGKLQTVNYVADHLGFRVQDSRIPVHVAELPEAPVHDAELPVAPVHEYELPDSPFMLPNFPKLPYMMLSSPLLLFMNMNFQLPLSIMALLPSPLFMTESHLNQLKTLLK